MLLGTCRGRKGRFPVYCVQSNFGVSGLPTPSDWQLLYKKAGRTARLTQGDIVVQQNDDNANDTLYIVRAGECELERVDAPGRAPRRLGKAAIGDVFNDLSFLLGVRSVASARVVSESASVCLLRVHELQELFAEHPRVGARVFKFLCMLSASAIQELNEEAS